MEVITYCGHCKARNILKREESRSPYAATFFTLFTFGLYLVVIMILEIYKAPYQSYQSMMSKHHCYKCNHQLF